MKKIEDFATEIVEQVNYGASVSDVIQILYDFSKHYYDEGTKYGYALARGATDLPTVSAFQEINNKTK